MMWLIRLIYLMILLVVGFGLFLHAKVQWPILQWIGHLPGDLLVRKGEAVIYFPLTTSFIFSGAISLLLSKLSRSSHQ